MSVPRRMWRAHRLKRQRTPHFIESGGGRETTTLNGRKLTKYYIQIKQTINHTNFTQNTYTKRPSERYR